MNRGLAKAELKQYTEAIADHDKAIELDPNYALAYYARGITYGELGKEEVKETAAETQKTQDFQKILEDLKKTLKKSEKRCLIFSVIVILITTGIFILPFFEDCLTCWMCFKIPENFLASYFLFPFLSIVSFTMLRIYTNTRKHRLETENRLAMAKLLARIEDQIKIPSESKTHYQEHFLPELAKNYRLSALPRQQKRRRLLQW